MQYYLIGIKGTGMTALANILADLGHEVRGVDHDKDFYTKELLARFEIETFDDCVIKDNFFYIIGNAYTKHVLTKKVISKGLSYAYYPKFVDSIFKVNKIAVCGSHGKTTTTKMISELLDNPSFLIGDGSGYGNSLCKEFVFEACEYQNTFLNYHPQILLILNIDYDHPDFFKDREEYFESFYKLACQSELVVYNGDSSYCKRLNLYNSISFGIEDDNDIVFSYKIENDKMIVYVDDCEFVLPILGKHYAYDFVGSYIVARLSVITPEKIQARIKNFKLPHRRMDEFHLDNQIAIVDYAHHPTEIEALYESLCYKYPNLKKIIIFESHTNSRSLKFLEQFKKALNLFDEVYLTGIFSSEREEGSREANQAYFEYLDFAPCSKDVLKRLRKENNTLVTFVGAGTIDELAKDYIS